MNTLKQYQALCDAMSSKEYADGAVTVEYVIIIMFVVGLGARIPRVPVRLHQRCLQQREHSGDEALLRQGSLTVQRFFLKPDRHPRS